MAMLLSTIKSVVSSSSASVIVSRITYDNRANLKINPTVADSLVLVESLGLFRFYSGSTELDDDETCFVNNGSNGAWILECPHWDFIESNTFYENEVKLDGKTGTVFNSTSTIAGNSSITLTTQILGVLTNQNVIVTPTTTLPGTIFIRAWVSVADTVEVMLGNSWAGTVTVPTGTIANILVI